VAGDEAFPVSGLFGVSFALDIEGSGNGWEVADVFLGDFLGSDVVFYRHIDIREGTIGCGISRKAGQGGVDGNGVVARMKIRTTDPGEILGLLIRDVAAVDLKGAALVLGGGSCTLAIEGNASGSVPENGTLLQNHPNPFNPLTTIRYAIPEDGNVALRVYNNLGREIVTLVEGRQEAGEHEVTFDGKDLPSGMYFTRLEAGSTVLTKKLLLLR